MFYWNHRNFAGLAQLAQALRADPRLHELARYCELREEGRRREAFAALDCFLTATLAATLDVQRELTLIVLGAHARIPEAHQFLSHPLAERLLVPVLRAWCESEPHNAVPLSELGQLRGDTALLARALACDPSDDRARRCLMTRLLAAVDFATHHLADGALIGTFEDCSETLSLAAHHLASAAQPEAFVDLSARVAEARDLLDDWRQYRKDPVGTFPDWCQERGRSHRWWRSVPYTR